jgi:hypothetical protein
MVIINLAKKKLVGVFNIFVQPAPMVVLSPPLI